MCSSSLGSGPGEPSGLGRMYKQNQRRYLVGLWFGCCSTRRGCQTIGEPAVDARMELLHFLYFEGACTRVLCVDYALKTTTGESSQLFWRGQSIRRCTLAVRWIRSIFLPSAEREESVLVWDTYHPTSQGWLTPSIIHQQEALPRFNTRQHNFSIRFSDISAVATMRITSQDGANRRSREESYCISGCLWQTIKRGWGRCLLQRHRFFENSHHDPQGTLPEYFVESWTYSSALSVVDQVDAWAASTKVESSMQSAFNAGKGELLELARHQVSTSMPLWFV